MLFQSSKARLAAASFVAINILLASCAKGQNATVANEQQMIEQVALSAELTVFRSPTCGCCGQWIAHMETMGFRVKDEITEEMAAIKQQYGVPASMTSCHTTVANGYVIEGHIPAVEVARLLTVSPDLAGIAVPGMPIGSPGMESGEYVEPYTVFSFTESGDTATVAEHG